MSAVRFAPGRGVAYVAPATLLLADHAEPDRRIAGLVLRDAPVDEVLDALDALGVHDRALARFDGDAVELAVRGAIAIDVERGVDRGDARPPREREPGGSRGEPAGERNDGVARWVVGGATAIRLALEGELGAEAPYVIAEGAVPASVLDWQVATADADPFDAMFGHTVARSVEDAAVRPGDSASDRPPLGVLLFSTGERVLVDRPLVLGRNPGVDDSVRQVRLTGAGVSRRHAAIHVDHWHAVIDDLGSVNGTEVTLPGHVRHRVLPGQPVALVPGARVDLGGEVSFVVEVIA